VAQSKAVGREIKGCSTSPCKSTWSVFLERRREMYIDPLYALMGLILVMIATVIIMGLVMMRMVGLLGGITREIRKASKRAEKHFVARTLATQAGNGGNGNGSTRTPIGSIVPGVPEVHNGTSS
jgi:hypothetical protein